MRPDLQVSKHSQPIIRHDVFKAAEEDAKRKRRRGGILFVLLTWIVSITK